MELWELSASEIAAKVRDRIISPVEVMEAFLDRINKLEPSLKAWVYLDPDQAIAEAKRK